MVAVVTGFITLFNDLGLSTATIQKEEIDQPQVSALFWLNVIFSIIAAGITVSMAPLLAQFYSEPRLVLVTVTLAVGIGISGFGVQHSALLRRQMRYKLLGFNEIASQFFGVVVAIALALNGLGYWALVAYTLATTIASTIGMWCFCRWRPSLPKYHPEVAALLTFGSHLTGFNIFNYFSRNMDNLLIGRFWGDKQLGLYAKAYQLLLLPITQVNAPISSVAIPTLSRLIDSPLDYQQAYKRMLQITLLITTPITAFMINDSNELILILLGDQWIEASNMFRFLGILGFVQPLAHSVGWLLISQNRAHHLFQWGLVSSIIICLSFLIGLPWQASGVALSYSLITTTVLSPAVIWFAGRQGPVSQCFIYVLCRPFIYALILTEVLFLMLKPQLESLELLPYCIVSLLIIELIFLVVMYFIPGGKDILYNLRKISKVYLN